MDLLELQPEEDEEEFLGADLLDGACLPENDDPSCSKLAHDERDLLDQIFGDDVNDSTGVSSKCGAPSFGDELSLFSASTPIVKKPVNASGSSAAAAAVDDLRDEGIFEDVDSSLGNIESFGEGPSRASAGSTQIRLTPERNTGLGKTSSAF